MAKKTRGTYDMLFNEDGSYKTTEQYLAETEPHTYTITTHIRHMVVRDNGETFAIIPADDFVTIGAVLAVIYDTETPPF